MFKGDFQSRSLIVFILRIFSMLDKTDLEKNEAKLYYRGHKSEKFKLNTLITELCTEHSQKRNFVNKTLWMRLQLTPTWYLLSWKVDILWKAQSRWRIIFYSQRNNFFVANKVFFEWMRSQLQNCFYESVRRRENNANDNKENKV